MSNYNKYDSRIIYKGKEIYIHNYDLFNKVRDYLNKTKNYFEIDFDGDLYYIKILAHKYLGNVTFDWIIFAANDITNIYNINLSKLKIPTQAAIRDILKF